MPKELTNWKNLIDRHMQETKEQWCDVEKCTLDMDELNREFYAGYGGPGGQTFTLWTKNRVYFPVCYDGAEWVGSTPRNPCDEATEHQGGFA